MNLIENLNWNGPVLVVPGLRGSGAAHWQTLWEARHPRWKRVEQADWNTPDLDRWARQIVEVALTLDEPALVIAHSFGCLATVRAEAFQSSLIAGALLVAPANPQKFGFDTQLARTPLPFPSTLVASRDDPWMPFDAAQLWAERWGSAFESVGHRGHINTDSGIGDWGEGRELLDYLCRRMSRRPQRMPAEPERVPLSSLRWAA